MNRSRKGRRASKQSHRNKTRKHRNKTRKNMRRGGGRNENTIYSSFAKQMTRKANAVNASANAANAANKRNNQPGTYTGSYGSFATMPSSAPSSASANAANKRNNQPGTYTGSYSSFASMPHSAPNAPANAVNENNSVTRKAWHEKGLGNLHTPSNFAKWKLAEKNKNKKAVKNPLLATRPPWQATWK